MENKVGHVSGKHMANDRIERMDNYMEYYRRHKGALHIFYHNIDQIVDKYSSKKTWIVFGSSRICGMIIHYLKVKGIQVSHIIDNDRASQNKTAFGVQIHKPEDLLLPKRKDCLVLIASAHQAAMTRQLESMGYTYGEDMIKVIDLPELMSDFSFENREGYQLLTSSEIRKHQLGILEYLKKICLEHQMEYFVIGGTLLGAVRHQGYIPWDDDIDVIMDIRDIIKLSAILKKDKRYKLISMFDEELDYFDECSLMVDTETVMDINRFPMQGTTGVSIDVFSITGIPDGQAGRDYIVEARSLESECYNSLYSPEVCRRNIDKLIQHLTKYEISSCNYAANALGRNFYREIVKKEAVQQHVEMPFEDRTIWAPAGWEQYLTQFFGDYMQLPPKEQQVAHHFFHAYKKKGESK